MKKMRKKVGKWKLMGSYIRSQLKFLVKARNFYVKTCSDCAANVHVSNYAPVGFVGISPQQQYSIHHHRTTASGGTSASVNSSVSRNTNGGREADHQVGLLIRSQARQQQRPIPQYSQLGMRRSAATVAVFGRIDENHPYDEDESIKLMPITNHGVFPRSISHAIPAN